MSDPSGTSEDMTMAIESGTGNLLTQDVDALVNTVNTQGVMGKGIALQFKKAWPEMFRAYKSACQRGEVTLGRMHVWETGQLTGPRFIINFPTKHHWRSRSRVKDIQAGLGDLVRVIDELGITSIAVPPLGCGNGGLDWAEVEPVIRFGLAPVAGKTEVRLFAPAGAPPAHEQPSNEPTPGLTSSRAALLALMREYERTTFEAPSLIAVQKLAYFLQASGEPLRLRFKEHLYGPYADDLRKSLRAMEGHYITGFGDGTAPVSQAEPIRVRREVEGELDAFIAQHPQTRRRIQQVLSAIEGFESTYGLELLATVHWVTNQNNDARQDAARAHAQVRQWSGRKSTLFTEHHVGAAWHAVHDRHLVA